LHFFQSILPKRQKLIGLKADGKVHDDLFLKQLKAKKTSSLSSTAKASGDNNNNNTQPNEIVHQFLLMGTPEEQIFIDPSEKDDLPDVVDDFDLDFNAGSDEWHHHVATGLTLKRFTEKTEIFFMNEPREGKPLLVLDLDHTLLDFSSKSLQRDVSTHVVGQGMAARKD
jgi:ubiquitin-like domain-containing CTD phosphatase 1